MKGYTPQTCPGISKFVRPVPEYFTCPSCGGDVEVWNEDIGVCMNCSKKISRSEKTTSCLDWCPQADKCREISRRPRLTFLMQRHET